MFEHLIERHLDSPERNLTHDETVISSIETTEALMSIYLFNGSTHIIMLANLELLFYDLTWILD